MEQSAAQFDPSTYKKTRPNQWQIERELEEFETERSFVGPCEMVVA